MQHWRLWTTRVPAITGLAALAGAVFGVMVTDTAAAGALRGAITGGLCGGLLTVLEVALLGSRGWQHLRRLPFLLLLAARTALYTAVIVLAILLGRLAVAEAVPEGAPLLGFDRDLVDSLVFSFAVSIAFNLWFSVAQLVGPQALLNFLTGRYHRPREEERAILLLDLVGSTAIAERIGNRRFLELLNAVYHAMSGPVLANGGEIHKYVGDEVIVSWPGTSAGASRAAACYVAIVAAVDARHADYGRAFGVVPQFWAGLHLGPVVIGEMGDLRQEIVMLGDTVNTAARIQQACRTHGGPCLASAAFVAAAHLPPGLSATPIGDVTLRGKAAPQALFRLVPAESGSAGEPAR